MRKYLIAGGLLILVAGGAYYALMIEPTRQFRVGLDQAIQSFAPAYAAQYRDARYSIFKHTATISGLTTHANADTANDYSFETVVVVNPNAGFLDDWQRAKANPSVIPQDKPLPIADRIEIKGFTVKATIGSGAIQSFSVDRPRVYPWALLHAGLPRWDQMAHVYTDAVQAQIAAENAQKQAEEKKKAGQETENADGDLATVDTAQSLAEAEEIERRQLEVFLPIARMEAALLLGIGIDGADADGVAYSFPPPAEGKLSDVDWRIVVQSLHEGGMDRGILTKATLDGVVEDLSPLAKFSAKHAVEERFSFRDTALRLLNGDAPSLAMLDGLSLGRMEVDGIDFTQGDGKATAIQAITVSDIVFGHSFLTSAGFRLEGAKIRRDMLPEPNSQKAFEQFGLDAATVSFGFSYKWVDEKSLARIEDISLKVDELGALKVSADISGITPGKLDSASDPALANARLRFDNVSLVQRLSGTSGMAQKEAGPARAKTVKAFLEGAGLEGNPDLAPSIKAIMHFARQPRSLTVTASPPMPMKLSDLQALFPQGPAAIFTALGLSVVADQ